jgi:hypothetical protein
MALTRVTSHISVAFTGGLLAAVVKNAMWWFLARHGLAEPYASAFAPHLTLNAIAPHLIWGGAWGLTFAIAVGPRAWWVRGVLWSLGPMLVELFYTLPHSGYGTLGQGLGSLAGAAVLAGYLVWGLVTALWIRLSPV